MTAPWNAYQWVNCTGSVFIQTLYPSTDESDSQRDGKAVHYIIEEMLKVWKDVTKTFRFKDFIGVEAPNGVIIDEDMAQAALDYVTDVTNYAVKRHVLDKVNIEDDLDLSHLGENMDNGRPDVYVWDENRREIFVSDFKYGHSIVDVFENHQLICYVSGILEKYKINGHDDQRINVRMRIFQPRAPHVDGPSREWVCRASDLRAYVNKIIAASQESHSENAKCKVGDWCGTCTGRHNCETFTRNYYAALDYINEPVPFELSNAGLSTEYLMLERAEKLLKARKSAIEPLVADKIKHGEQLPGLGVQQGYGHEKWKSDVPMDEIIMMAELLDVDINKPREIDTPAKVRQKGIDPEVISNYSYRPKTKLKIVKDDGSKARQVFRKQ